MTRTTANAKQHAMCTRVFLSVDQAGCAPLSGAPSPTQNGRDDGLSPGTGDTMPTTPASGAPRPDVVVGLWNCNAAHMPDVSEHPGGPSLRGDRRPKPPVGFSFGGAAPVRRNAAHFFANPCTFGLRAALPTAKGQAPEEGERERERGCRRPWEGGAEADGMGARYH